MSLISARNFAAPFERRWQLITMLLVTLLFALLRVATVRMPAYQPAAQSNYNPAYTAPSPAVPVQPVAAAAPAAQVIDQPAARAPMPSFESSRASVLNDLFGNDEQPASEAARDEAPKRGGLDDIEAKLGLR